MALGLALSLLLSSAPQAQAKSRIYAGSEAEALKCAHLFSMTALLLWKSGKISTRAKDSGMAASVIILDRYVGGTWEQKKKALTAVGQRRTLLTTLEEFNAQNKYCLRRFPIN
ncbi:hypothetical protein [Rhodalgimonas zhirmunskyi]|uniref:hypothetical protein n=1 Tax=Rhodalgimonas zhirmunskyi TaxID=2964767 RepID=UPI0029529334|nr:hypothetical protein [Rhodoalgimonas zhirmunskyi]